MYIEAVRHKGFAIVNDFSPCVTYNKFNTYDWFRAHCEMVSERHDPTNEDAAWELIRDFERREKLPLGIIYRKPRERVPAKRVPMWQAEIERIDTETMLKGLR
jgi:2-oxoglutarate ferredoxin oxidoreductase subunit beta